MNFVIAGITAMIVLSSSVFTGIGVMKNPQTNEDYRDSTAGTILYVGGSGAGNYSTIQDAVDNATDYDTVFVFDESSPYYEHVIVNKTVTLLGENKRTTVIDGGDVGDVLTINKPGVTVSGFTLRRNGWYDDGIILNADNAIIRDNNISNCGDGIKAIHVNNTVITLNEFFENEMGIMMYGVANTTVSTNTLTATYLYGIDLAESDGGNIIAGNTITANTDIAIQASYVGIRLWGSRHTMISDNTLISLLDTCHGGLELWMSADNAIQHNIFVKNGVLLYNSYQNTISDDNTVNGKPLIFLREETNKTVENAGQVILVQCDRIIVRHCELSYVQTGVTLLNTTNSDIVNNTIYSCNDGIQLEGSHANTLFQNSIMNCEEGVYVATSPANNIVNNSIRESTYYGILTSAMSITISGNVISDNPVGISIVGKRNNKIIGNIIENSSIGIELTATIHTTIEKNNFIRNACDAFFDTAVRNYWRQNYWEKPTRLPHLIRGYLVTLEYYPPFGGGFVLRVPWVNVDWHPARVPYEISFPSSS